MRIYYEILNDTQKEKTLRIAKYAYIIKNINNINITSNPDFQKTFNGFFKVRRNEKWRKIYYSIMEKAKSEPLTFRQVITEMYNKTGRIEASFTSKLLASIDTDKPIWDKYVLENLGLVPSGKNPHERIENACQIYDALTEWYYNFLRSDEGKKCIMEFNKKMPDYSWISNTKKIDFLIWRTR